MHIPNRTSQKGIVLIVSLLILLVLTMLGISAISNTSMEERMSNNFQQSMVAFQASESAISQTILRGDSQNTAFYSEARDANGISADPFLAALDAGVNTTTTTITYNANPNNQMNGIAVQTTATVSYIGDFDCDESSSGTVACKTFEISTDTTIDGTVIGQNHLQALEIQGQNQNTN